jgi:hypothetical protein
MPTCIRAFVPAVRFADKSSRSKGDSPLALAMQAGELPTPTQHSQPSTVLTHVHNACYRLRRFSRVIHDGPDVPGTRGFRPTPSSTVLNTCREISYAVMAGDPNSSRQLCSRRSWCCNNSWMRRSGSSTASSCEGSKRSAPSSRVSRHDCR